MTTKKILVIYPEPLLTRIAVYQNTDLIFLKTLKHKEKDLKGIKNLIDQKKYRKDFILRELEENDINTELIEVVMAMSGLVKPLESGISEVNDRMKEDLRMGVMGKHAVNLGGLMAAEIAESFGKKAYLSDPVVVDELDDVARVTGHPMFKSKSIFHALSHKYVARKYAKSVHKEYEDLNLIVVHVGTEGISIGAHKKGRVVDVNNTFDGDGPFSISRTGSLPVGDLVKLCFSGKYSEEEIMDMITEEGGYAAYLGTSDISKIDSLMIEGDETALFYSYACAYQVSKEVGAMYTVLAGEVDAIILSGNIFNSEYFLKNVSERVGKISDILMYPSINNFEALAMAGLSIIKGEAEILEYT
jgi:butyrate kinase